MFTLYILFLGFKASKLSGDTTENKRLKKILERELKHAQNRKKGDKAQLKQMDKIKDDLAESNQSVQTDSKVSHFTLLLPETHLNYRDNFFLENVSKFYFFTLSMF
jgi:hypothetical protein